jgi:hypothetical protein
MRNRNETLCYLAEQLVTLKAELLHDDSHHRASVVINQAYDNVGDNVGSAMNGCALQTYLRLVNSRGTGPVKALAMMNRSHPTFRCPNLKYNDHRQYGAITASQCDVNDPEFLPSFYSPMAAIVPDQRCRNPSHETGNRSREVRQSLDRDIAPQQLVLSRQDIQRRRIEHLGDEHGDHWMCPHCTIDNTRSALYLECEVCGNTRVD